MVSKPRIKREVRRLLAEAAERPVQIEVLIEAEGIELVFDRLESDENVSGFYFRKDDRRVIGVNSAHAPVRQRFTMAHELGHALLHDAEGLHLDQAFKLRDRKSSMAIDPEEIAANAFAAELLMPEHEVRALAESGIDLNDDSEMAELARQFGVSSQAFTYRLANLGILVIDGAASL